MVEWLHFAAVPISGRKQTCYKNISLPVANFGAVTNTL